MYTIVSTALLAVLVSASGPVAQEVDAPQEQQQVWSTGRQLWGGSLRDDLAPHIMRAFSIPDSAFEEELARIRLAVLSRGEHEKAIDESTAMWLRMAWRATPECAGPLTRCVSLRAWVLSEAGLYEKALVASRAPLPTHGEILEYFKQGYTSTDLGAGTELWTGLAEALEVDPELVELRQRIEAASAETGIFVGRCRKLLSEDRFRYLERNFGLPSDEVAELIVNDLATGHYSRLKKLGSQGVAAIAFVALADPDANGLHDVGTSASRSSVLALLRLDRMRALQLFAEWFEAGGSVWRSRILEACQGESDLQNESAWVPFPPPMKDVERTGGRPWTPEWIPVIARLITDEQTREEGLQLARPCAEWDALTPALQEALSGCIRSDSQLLASKVLAALGENLGEKLPRVPSAYPIYVAGLESPFPDIRHACAWRLSSCAAVEALQPFFGDPDPQVRQAVARVFGVDLVTMQQGSGAQVRTRPERVYLTPERIPIIEALLADEVEAVRQEAEKSLGSMDWARATIPQLVASRQPQIRCYAVAALSKYRLTPVEHELLRRLLQDPAASVRSQLATRWRHIDTASWKTSLDALTGDPDPEVLRALDLALSASSVRDINAKSAVLAALPARLANPAEPFTARCDGEDLGLLRLVQKLDVAFVEAPFVLAYALEHGHDWTVANLLDSVIRPSEVEPVESGTTLGLVYPIVPRQDRLIDAHQLRALDPPARRALYDWPGTPDRPGSAEQKELRKQLIGRAMLRGPGPDDEAAILAIEAGNTDRAWVLQILSSSSQSTPERQALRWRVFKDETAPLELRLAAGAGIDFLFRPEGEKVLDSLLEAAHRATLLDELGEVVKASEWGNEYILRVMKEARLTGYPLELFVDWAFEPEVGRLGTDEAATEVLDRFLSAPGDGNTAVEDALTYLGDSMLVYEHPEHVLSAARDWRYIGTAIAVMGQRRSPEFFEALCSMFDHDWPGLTTLNTHGVRQDAILALAEYGGRGTMEFLTGLLFEVDEDLRETIIFALEDLKKVEDLRASWRTPPLPERDAALIELVEMLSAESPQIRAAAARGLAAFGALEAIPQLIRLLEDDSELVRAAAEKALERLYELPVEAETGAEAQEEKDESEGK